ncbi:allatostatin-A receptor-like [Oculina patagonica]
MTNMTSADLGLAAAFSVVVVINLLGNGLVCLVVFRFRGMRAPINYLLVNLAVSDMMVALFIIPDYIVNWTFQHPSGDRGDYMCTFITGGNFVWVGMAASTFSLVVIAVERYIVVVHPLNESWRLTSRRLTAVLIAGWLYAIVFNLPLFFVVGHKEGVTHCVEDWSNKKLAELYTVVCFFVFGAIPMGAIAFLYVRVLCKLWKSGVRATLISEQARIRAVRKVTKMAVVMSIAYAVCRLPNLVLYMISQFEPKLYDYDSPSYIISVLLVALNSAMNPFIYTLQSTNFRQHIKVALCCRDYRPADYLRIP